MTKWGNHKSDTMAKVQHISGISKRIPFEGFDFYDLFRVTFENSELGRMKRLLPLHEMAVNFGLVSQRLGIHTANAVHIAERLAELQETKAA